MLVLLGSIKPPSIPAKITPAANLQNDLQTPIAFAAIGVIFAPPKIFTKKATKQILNILTAATRSNTMRIQQKTIDRSRYRHCWRNLDSQTALKILSL
jgi:hypothetical protein